jgi:hypothetical protein
MNNSRKAQVFEPGVELRKGGSVAIGTEMLTPTAQNHRSEILLILDPHKDSLMK